MKSIAERDKCLCSSRVRFEGVFGNDAVRCSGWCKCARSKNSRTKVGLDVGGWETGASKVHRGSLISTSRELRTGRNLVRRSMQWHGFRSVVRNAGVQGPKKQRQQLGPDYLKTALGRGAPAQLEPRAGKALGRPQSVGKSKWILTRAWKYRYLQMSVSFQCSRTERDSAQHTGVRVPYCVK